MAAFKRNLRIPAGDDYEKRFFYKTGEDRTPFDFAGCTARAQIRANLQSPAALDLTTANGGVTLGADPGSIDLYIPKEQTSALPLRTGIWAIEIVFANGRTRTLIEGQVAVTPEIVR